MSDAAEKLNADILRIGAEAARIRANSAEFSYFARPDTTEIAGRDFDYGRPQSAAPRRKEKGRC